MTTSRKKQPSSPKKLRIGFIGLGNISHSHLLALENIPEVEVVAGADIRAERGDWFKQEPGCSGATFYLDYEEMLKKEKLDAVDICTPNGVHCPATLAALKAGCHVMTEKPMGMSVAECEKMVAAAKKAKKLLCCGFQIRYSPKVQLCKRAINEGIIGDVTYIKVHALRRRGVPNWGVFGRKELQGGGPMIDIGIHMIESAHYAMGEPKPVAVCGRTWTFLGNKPSKVESFWPGWDYKHFTVEDLAVGQVRFENGAIMQIESSFCNHIAEDAAYWELFGTKGSFNMQDGTIYTDMVGNMVDIKPAFFKPNPWPADFESKLQNFVDAIRKGTPLCVPGEEGLVIQKIINGLYDSAEKGGAEVLLK